MEKEEKKEERSLTVLETVNKFMDSAHTVDRTVFESAMIKRIKEKGYTMSDLIYELYCCQRAIGNLSLQIEELKEVIKPKKKR